MLRVSVRDLRLDGAYLALELAARIGVDSDPNDLSDLECGAALFRSR